MCLGVVHVIAFLVLYTAGIVAGPVIRTIVLLQVSVHVRQRYTKIAGIVSWMYSAGIIEAVGVLTIDSHRVSVLVWFCSLLNINHLILRPLKVNWEICPSSKGGSR